VLIRQRLPTWLGGPKPNFFWLTPTLAVGGANVAGSPRRLHKLGVRAVLDMQAEAGDRSAAFAAEGLAYLKTPVADFHAPGQRQLDEATAWVLEQTQREGAVLIHCRVGLGRSATLALATLLRVGYDLPTAYNLVRKARPELHLSESQLDALRRYEERLRNDSG
jgi:hypothetical protein